MSLCLALGGCGSSATQNASGTSGDAEQTIMNSDENAPMSEVISEEELRAILEENVSLLEGQEILTLYDDFDQNGEYEVFAFVGTSPAEGDDWGVYEGDIWYADQDECICLDDSYESYYQVLWCLDFGQRKFACFNRYFATESPTKLFSVKNGSVYEDEHSGIGNVYGQDGNQFMISYSAYDVTYDASMELMLGHSWKPFYYYYDVEKDAICEVASKEISQEEAEALLPEDAFSLISEKEGTITTCFLRDNGILSVNYEITEADGSIHYCNANYDTVGKCYLDAYGLGENTLEASDFGGTYEH